MALLEELEISGNRLFRWRSYLPLILVAIFLLAMPDYDYFLHDKDYQQYWEIFCLAISYFGLFIRILTIGHSPERTSGRNTREQIADTLNTDGMYSMVRNPLYLGNFFMGLGVALLPHMWRLALIYVLLFWLYYERIIIAEEAFLRKKFGQAYLTWARATPAFIPRFGMYRKPQLGFSIRNVLRREYNGFFAIIVAMFLLKMMGHWLALNEVMYDPWWATLVVSAFLIWLVLRTLKKHTGLLRVAGR